MPTVHIANLSVTLTHDSAGWGVSVTPGDTDPHWVRREAGWEFVLAYEEYGDTVEFRVPTTIEHDGCTFQLSAESTVGSGTPQAWSGSAGSLCSSPFSAVTSFYVDVEATPLDSELPVGLPPDVNPRGGGHYHVKNAGGDGDRSR
jgi:hypothetical protein